MAGYERELKRAPVGMNDNADASLVPEQRCAAMIGLCQISPGILGEVLRKRTISLSGSGGFTVGLALEAIIPYYGTSAANDQVLVIQAGSAPQMYKSKLHLNQPCTVPDAINPSLDAFTAITNNSGVNFTAGKRVRWVQYRDEVIMVQDGGLTPLRFNGTTIYKLGIAQPPVPTFGAVAAGALTGTYQYWVTRFDELGRESSPSPVISVTLAGQRQVVNWTAAGATENVQGYYLYRTLSNANIGYRVLEAGFNLATTTYNDNITDATISGNSISPQPFENEPPVSASLVAVWRDRLVLNSAADRTVIQVSNETMPGQFSALGSAQYPTDGITMSVLTQYGDEVTALHGTGSALAILTRKTVRVLLGDQPANFVLMPVHHSRGCVSPDAVVQCENVLMFPSEDGVYELAFTEGFQVRKISEDMDNTFKAAAIQWSSNSSYPPSTWYQRANRDASAIAWFMQGRYYLAMVPYVYVFQFDGNGWCMDFMSDMPNDNGVLAAGYLSAAVVHAERTVDIVLYNPGMAIYGGQNRGFIYVGSYFPLMTQVIPRTYSFVYETRAIDGGGVHRTSIKRAVRTTLFGSIALAPSDPNAELALTGTITMDVDNGQYTESYPFGIFGTYASEFARAQRDGSLIVQNWSPKCTGRILKVSVKADGVSGRLSLSDWLCQYERRT